MKENEKSIDKFSPDFYLNLQKILRSLDFGKTLNTKVPSITITQMRVLSFFNESDIIYISDISHRLGMSIQSVNNIVRRLEDADYVVRSPNKQNKRFSDIKLTTKGKKRFTAVQTNQLNTLSMIVQRLKPASKKALENALQEAADILEEATVDIVKDK
jgi:DNA-binding MarR family transcriptional regulator